MHRCAAQLILLALLGCGASRQAPSTPPPPSDAQPAIDVPVDVSVRALPRRRIATGLHNPRGMLVLDDGAMLVAEAGDGDPGDPNTGRLTRLTDVDGDGDYDDEGERAVLLDAQPSKNIVTLVRRDEVFGMAAIARGGETVLVSLAFFGGPTTIFEVTPQGVKPWSSTHGNINDLTYDPRRGAWYGASSTSDEIVQLIQGGTSQRVMKLAPLAQGQDAVPGYVRHDPVSGDLLVSLFGGSPLGEEGGRGTELVQRGSSIVRLDVQTRASSTVVSGLTAPTDIEVGPNGELYVLELCRDFVDPVTDRPSMIASGGHGGFRHFSGRLLRIDRKGGTVEVIADGLDAPTNLELAGNALYVSQGMGTPGRTIPGPNGPQPLDGFIERIDLR